MTIFTIYGLRLGLFRAMFVYILSHHVDALEDFLAFGGILQLDAIFFLHHDNQFQSINAVETQAFAEERCIVVDVGGRDVFEVQYLDNLFFQLQNQFFHS